MRRWPLLLAGGGVAGVVAAFLLRRRADATTSEITRAMSDGGTFEVHATGYWPFSARPDERSMEGGVEGAAAWGGKRVVDPTTGKRVQLHTVEDFFAGKSDHASLSGDPSIFPFGQKLLFDWFGKQLVGRVTDTGGHFAGAGKVYRVVGQEPLDFCVASSKSPVPRSPLTATIVAGDHWDKPGREIATDGFKGQTVTVSGLRILGRKA
jgi:hypothetical protein